MPSYCVAANCTNKGSSKDGISIHIIPYYNDERPEAKRRRRLWVDFISARRLFVPSKTSTICSAHFTPDDYERRFFSLPGLSKPNHPKLKTDELGVCVFPSIHASSTKDVEPNDKISARGKRLVMRKLQDKEPEETPSKVYVASLCGQKASRKYKANNPGKTNQTSTSSAEQDQRARQEMLAPVEETCDEPLISPEDAVMQLMDESMEIDGNSTPNDEVLRESNRRLRNKVKSLQTIQNDKRRELKNMRRKVNHLEDLLQQVSADKNRENNVEEQNQECDFDHDIVSDDDEQSEADPLYEMETDEIPASEDEDSLDDEAELSRIDGNIRTEPKYITFLTQLLLLFKFCHSCKTENPLLETRQVGTKVVVTTICVNHTCKQKISTWHSQPNMPNLKVSAGNFLLPMAVLFGGGSITKVRQMFIHMGLSCISLNTYFRHQRTLLFPAVYLHWQKYQKTMLEKAKAIKDGVVISGDGRHDSMGHSAKFCAYTIFFCTFPQIIHFDLVQRNQAGSSPAMEFMCFKLCMDHIIAYGIGITTFISDRHTSIAKYMKTTLKDIIHFFDIWHLKKKIRKVLSKLSKEKDCEALNEWIKPCENHLHWSATSTFSGNGLVIWAKFKSFLRHIVNQHSNHSDPLFNRCGHGANIDPRKWLTVDSPLHEKVCAILTNARLVNGIKQASPLDQTSCLEGFHSVLNHFAPKMIAYSNVGQYCRHILAIMHFNCNLQREPQKRRADGQEKIKITYPKFKNGEATVRHMRVAQNFAYVQEIFDTFLTTTKKDLEDAAAELKKKSPEPMNSMLEQQPKAQAIAKRTERMKMVIKDVPPTTPVSEVQRVQEQRQKEKSKPHCQACKLPMKGHKFVTDCPRNNRQ